MELRKIRDADDARACLDAAAASGLPRAKWAKQQGIEPRSLNAWRINLSGANVAETGAPSDPLCLVEVTPLLPVLRRPAVYTIYAGAFRLEVGDDFADATLRRLLSVVSAC